MGVPAIGSEETEAKKEVQVTVKSVKEDGKDKAESGKPGPNRILRYAEVWVSFDMLRLSGIILTLCFLDSICELLPRHFWSVEPPILTVPGGHTPQSLSNPVNQTRSSIGKSPSWSKDASSITKASIPTPR